MDNLNKAEKPKLESYPGKEQPFADGLTVVLVRNTPGVFAAAWRLVKGILPKRDVEKVQFFEKKQDDAFQKALFALVAPEQVPGNFGGDAAPLIGCGAPVLAIPKGWTATRIPDGALDDHRRASWDARLEDVSPRPVALQKQLSRQRSSLRETSARSLGL